MTIAKLALLSAALLIAGPALASEKAAAKSECIARPAYWGYEAQPCEQDAAPARDRFMAKHQPKTSSSQD
jgi:hypothetical protein